MRRIINFFTQRIITPVNKTKGNSETDFLEYQKEKKENETTRNLFLCTILDYEKQIKYYEINISVARLILNELETPEPFEPEDLELPDPILQDYKPSKFFEIYKIRKNVCRERVLEWNDKNRELLAKIISLKEKCINLRLKTFQKLFQIQNKDIFQTVIYSNFPHIFLDSIIKETDILKS